MSDCSKLVVKSSVGIDDDKDDNDDIQVKALNSDEFCPPPTRFISHIRQAHLLEEIF